MMNASLGRKLTKKFGQYGLSLDPSGLKRMAQVRAEMNNNVDFMNFTEKLCRLLLSYGIIKSTLLSASDIDQSIKHLLKRKNRQEMVFFYFSVFCVFFFFFLLFSFFVFVFVF